MSIIFSHFNSPDIGLNFDMFGVRKVLGMGVINSFPYIWVNSSLKNCIYNEKLQIGPENSLETLVIIFIGISSNRHAHFWLRDLITSENLWNSILSFWFLVDENKSLWSRGQPFASLFSFFLKDWARSLTFCPKLLQPNFWVLVSIIQN